MQQKLPVRSGRINQWTTDVSEFSEADISIDDVRSLHGYFVYAMVTSGRIGRIYADDSIKKLS